MEITIYRRHSADCPQEADRYAHPSSLRRGAPGTGLSELLARRLAGDHHGRIRVERVFSQSPEFTQFNQCPLHRDEAINWHEYYYSDGTGFAFGFCAGICS